MATWTYVGMRDEIPRQGARTVMLGDLPVAVFRTLDNLVFALVDRCPHKQGPLSQGIVHGHAVTCPLHNWKISLLTGEAQDGDTGCTKRVMLRLEGERILLARADELAAAA